MGRMPAVVHHIQEAGVRRRWHPRDYHGCGEGGEDLDLGGRRQQAPNVHNSLAIQKKHVASMYRSVELHRGVIVVEFAESIGARSRWQESTQACSRGGWNLRPISCEAPGPFSPQTGSSVSMYHLLS